MKWADVSLASPTEGEVLIRHTAVGFNLVDTKFRNGLHSLPHLPHGIGVEGAGIIEKIGKGVTEFKPGDRVAYAGGAPSGSYSEARVRSTNGLMKIPAWMDDKTAAGVLSKGRTAEYLFHRTHKLKKSDTILFYAAAGGVGLFACQMARTIGATMIGVVSTAEKGKLAKRYGCKHIIVTQDQNDIITGVRKLTKGHGVDVVFDSVGKSYWSATLDAVRPLGLVVTFGIASGELEILRTDLSKKSIFLTSPTTNNYMATDADRAKSTRNLFKMIKSGAVKVPIRHVYDLKDAVKVHSDVEARLTAGVVVMMT